MSAPAAPAAFRLQLPTGWIDYDLGRQDFTRQQSEMRSAASTPEERRAVDDLFRQVRRLVRTSRQRGALSAAGLIASFPEGLLMAFVSVFALTVPDDAELSVDMVAAQLNRPARADGYGARNVTAVDLPDIGTVARITGTEIVKITDETSAVMLAMHTIVPLPGDPRSCLIVTGMSPNLTLTGELHDVFDAITATFRFL